MHQKFILLFSFILLTCTLVFGRDVQFQGVFFGPYPEEVKSRFITHPMHFYTNYQIETVVKEKITLSQSLSNLTNQVIEKATQQAKEMAEKNDYRYYAVINLSIASQLVMNNMILYTAHYNLLVMK